MTMGKGVNNTDLRAETLSAGYAAEICPIRLRGLAGSFISMAWGSGGFIASGVTRASLDITGTQVMDRCDSVLTS